jgi:amidase
MGEALWQKGAVEVAAGMREKHFSCSEVMVSVVERIRALNPRLNAIAMDLSDQAIAPNARVASKRRCKGAVNR